MIYPWGFRVLEDFHEYFGTIFECRLVNSGDVSIPEMPPPRFEVVRPPPTEMSLMASGMLSTGMQMAIPGMTESSEIMDGEEIQRRGGGKLMLLVVGLGG